MIRVGKIRGFTLIELLIVIAILGVLAVVVVVAINPLERIAQSRDAGRIAGVAQLGRSVQGYYAQNSFYPDVSTWAQDLVDSSMISAFPAGISYSATSATNCTTYVQPADPPTFCYDLDSTNEALVFARAESTSHLSKCTAPEVAYFVYSTQDGRGGTICSNGDPAPWASGTQTYVD